MFVQDSLLHKDAETHVKIINTIGQYKFINLLII